MITDTDGTHGDADTGSVIAVISNTFRVGGMSATVITYGFARPGVAIDPSPVDAPAALTVAKSHSGKYRMDQPKMCFRAISQMATTAGCLIFRSMEMA